MEDFASLSQREFEHFLFAVESSVQVRRSHQFFLWAQGQLQGLLPHGVLFCVHGDLLRLDYATVKYCNTPFPEAHFAELCQVEGGLVARTIAGWYRNWEEPYLVCPQMNGSGAYREFEPLLARYRLINLACHGTQNVNGGTNSYFIFANIPQPLGARHRYLLEMLVPHLHAAHVRTLIDHRKERGVAPTDPLLTGREVEILRWVSDGKSNIQIGNALKISPLTVKNHVQNILKKLAVQNRAQAVSKAMNLKLLDASPRL